MWCGIFMNPTNSNHRGTPDPQAEMHHDVLLIEPDEETFRQLEQHCLDGLGVIRVTTAADGEARLSTQDFSLVICADDLPDLPGLMFLAHTIDLRPMTQRVLMCRELDADLQQEVLRSGSLAHFLPKPIDPVAAKNLIDHALEQSRVLRRLVALRQTLNNAEAELSREHGRTAGGEGAGRTLLWVIAAAITFVFVLLVGLVGVYLAKSALGIDLLPDQHAWDLLRR